VLRIPKKDSSKNTNNWVAALTDRTTTALEKWLEERSQHQNQKQLRDLLHRRHHPHTSHHILRLTRNPPPHTRQHRNQRPQTRSRHRRQHNRLPQKTPRQKPTRNPTRKTTTPKPTQNIPHQQKQQRSPHQTLHTTPQRRHPNQHPRLTQPQRTRMGQLPTKKRNRHIPHIRKPSARQSIQQLVS
jgi:hypothetical protein